MPEIEPGPGSLSSTDRLKKIGIAELGYAVDRDFKRTAAASQSAQAADDGLGQGCEVLLRLGGRSAALPGQTDVRVARISRTQDLHYYQPAFKCAHRSISQFLDQARILEIAMSGYYDLKRSGDQYMFNLKAGNNEVILTSERYTTKAGAQDGISSVRQNSPIDARYQLKTATDGSPYFTLTGANGQVIGRSEMYSSTAARDKGVASVKGNGPTFTVKDNT